MKESIVWGALVAFLLIAGGCAAPNDVSRIRHDQPTSTEEAFSLRRAFREIFSKQTFQQAAHSFFPRELGPPPDLHSGKVQRELIAEFGKVNAVAVEALVLRDYATARKYAHAALKSPNGNERRDAAWILALAAAETYSPDKMDTYYRLLVREDERVKSTDEARKALAQAKIRLERLRDYFARSY